MELVDDTMKPKQKINQSNHEPVERPVEEVPCIETVLSLMTNIVETACEHEPDLDLVRLINFMDLYRVYVQHADDETSEFHADIASISGPSDAVLTQTLGKTDFVSFERFVRDSRLLKMAALAASAQSEEKVASPTPLTVSANT